MALPVLAALGYALTGSWLLLGRSADGAPWAVVSEAPLAASDAPLQITRADLRRALDSRPLSPELPRHVVLSTRDRLPPRLTLEYTLDGDLQEAVEHDLARYRPDWASVVMLDVDTGRVLAMADRAPDDAPLDRPLALRGDFLAASTFKIVTAAAAIEARGFGPDTQIAFLGRDHTLYRKHVFGDATGRWARSVSLEDAFARSINTVFGKIGALELGYHELDEYASRFGFNVEGDSDLPVERSQAFFAPDAWSLAEAGSGFTRRTSMSPLEGAVLAATVAGDGVRRTPWVVARARIDDPVGRGSEIVYEGAPHVEREAIRPETAREIRELMQRTVTRGTARKSFRGFSRGRLADVEVGGKTGSLNGESPPGRHDWFVGYGIRGDERVAVAVVTVNGPRWRVKPATLARAALEEWFSRAPAPAQGS